ncbi:inter-alpha-trypsin inhibitor heavy chain h3 [Anaeramoeba ignava]|uniref:Inter-alpha-trypsin inhibitor heavy chain h3 n=1 Tax=Anaeramoeba ignava TaxID=1746090 RepID=A0A9Q0LTQ1_ANAIG|nr:inter-alpha-trypsin inhibitor heavy chain h3 [Anaeramoeba ignava]
MQKSFGGAKDITNFRINVQKKQTVVESSITYHGLFSEYYFNAGKPEEEKLMSVQPFCAISPNLETKEKEYYLSVMMKSKYDGEGIKKFGRPLINCVIVLDISGSMSMSFTGDWKRNENTSSKLEVAKRTIIGLTEHLKDDDYLGIVIFDDDAEVLIPLQKFGEMDMEKFKKTMKELDTRGGTNLEEGFIEGSRMIENHLKKFKGDEMKEYEHRILYLTDAHPTTGETRSDGLFSLTKKSAEKKIYTTFIGVGVDFNTELIDVITKTKGANYYSVNSSSEFKRRMDTEFDYIMTPICFDVNVTVEGAKIQSIYGSPDSEQKKDTTVAEISTTMPSDVNENGEVQGCVLLLKMDKSVADGIPLNIVITYKDKYGNDFKEVTNVIFPELSQNQNEFFEDKSIRKAILLIRLVDLVKKFHKVNDKEKGQKFLEHLKTEIPIIGDEKLNREIDLLNDLLKD